MRADVVARQAAIEDLLLRAAEIIGADAEHGHDADTDEGQRDQPAGAEAGDTGPQAFNSIPPHRQPRSFSSRPVPPVRPSRWRTRPGARVTTPAPG